MHLLRSAIQRVDFVLQRRQGVHPFTNDESCLLRIACIRAPKAVVLSDGTRVRPGDTIVDIHLWNEHLAPLLGRDPGIVNLARAWHEMQSSFTELARCTQACPELMNATAFRGRVAFTTRQCREKVFRIATAFGFEFVHGSGPSGLAQPVHDFLDNFWQMGLIWTFNPHSRNRWILMREREELWISRTALLRRFGDGAPAPVGRIERHAAAPRRRERRA